MKPTLIKLLSAIGITIGTTIPSFAEINIGVVFSLTGPAASSGTETRKSVDLYPKEVGGEQVNYIVLDDATDPTNAVKNARKLIGENNVDALFGFNLTSAALAMADIAAENGVPLLAQAPIEVSPEKLKWAFRVEPLADVMVGRVVADMKSSGAKTVAFIGFSDPWGELLLQAIKKSTEQAGIQLVSIERFNRTDTSVMAQALKIIGTKPDAVFVGGAGTPAAMPHATLRERGYKGQIYHSHAVANKDFLRVGGKAIEGARLAVAPVLVAEQLPDSHPNKATALQFLKALEAKHGSDSRSTFAGASWDGAQILTAALEEALKEGKGGKPGTADFRKSLRDALEQTHKLVGANGTYTMSPTDHGGYDPAAAVLIEVREGKWQFLP